LYKKFNTFLKTIFMFEEILQHVKEHFAQNPEVAAAIPADKMEAQHAPVDIMQQNTAGLDAPILDVHFQVQQLALRSRADVLAGHEAKAPLEDHSTHVEHGIFSHALQVRIGDQ